MSYFYRKIAAKNARPGDYIKFGGEYIEITKVAKGFDGGYYAYIHNSNKPYLIQDGAVEIHNIFRKEKRKNDE